MLTAFLALMYRVVVDLPLYTSSPYLSLYSSLVERLIGILASGDGNCDVHGFDSVLHSF